MDKILYGLGVAGLGMITVFAGLIILIVFIAILGKFTSRDGKKKSKPASVEVKNSDEIPGDVLAAITAAVSMYDQTIPSDVVAAIAGALHVVMGDTKFVVKHVKRIHNAPAWNRAGREEQIYSRF